MDGSPELRFSVYSTRFDEKEALGERGGDGELTESKSNEREAIEAALRSVDGGSRAKLG